MEKYSYPCGTCLKNNTMGMVVKAAGRPSLPVWTSEKKLILHERANNKRYGLAFVTLETHE